MGLPTSFCYGVAHVMTVAHARPLPLPLCCSLFLMPSSLLLSAYTMLTAMHLVPVLSGIVIPLHFNEMSYSCIL